MCLTSWFVVVRAPCGPQNMKDEPYGFNAVLLWPLFPTLMELCWTAESCSPRLQAGQGVRLIISVWKVAFQQSAASSGWDEIWRDIWPLCWPWAFVVLKAKPLACPPAILIVALFLSPSFFKMDKKCFYSAVNIYIQYYYNTIVIF